MDQKTLDKNKRIDIFARRFISVGGVMILICVIGMIAMMLKVTLPLFTGADKERLTSFRLPGLEESATKPLCMGVDQYLETGYWIGVDGRVRVFDFLKGELAFVRFLDEEDEKTLVQAECAMDHHLSLLYSDGSQELLKIGFSASYDESGENRKISAELESLTRISADKLQEPAKSVQIRHGEDQAISVALLESGKLQLSYVTGGEEEEEGYDLSFLGLDEEEEVAAEEEASSTGEILSASQEDPILAFALDKRAKFLYGGTEGGRLLRWSVADPDQVELTDELFAFADRRSLTAVNLVFGDESLAVGDAKGEVTTWFLAHAKPGTNVKSLTLIHRLSKHEGPVKELIPSFRHKSILSRDEKGKVKLDHMTSENDLLSFEEVQAELVAFSTRGTGVALLTPQNQVELFKVHSPHPEASWKTYFGRIWYESYEKPEYVWQSSSGSDDFEPKLSLVPLIFGSLKGTFFAMIFALPLGILAAIYTNEFATPRFRNVVKPAVEITAAVPSVIIGFMAALWLAPIIDQGLMAFFLFWPMLLVVFSLFLVLWSRLREIKRLQIIERGFEATIILPLVLLSLFLTIQVAPGIEAAFFAGDFKNWIYQSVTQSYDQRNSIIISFGLGFIVIPFIFTMTDDALSSVPPSLKAASLALGASRWQTLWKVLLPSASPGIFAGVILGMGRAIGETMIVLMATGNTPIIDMSIFNGMRTLSANIAVEIPEAPVDGTLYRTLFLSAMILFGFTFVLNSLAEIVRTALRKKYGQF